MPIYSYACKECKKSFTQQMTITEYGKRRVACPKCNSKKVEQKVFELNGKKGLYSTAYYDEETFWKIYNRERYVELKRAGTGSWKGLCPFHSEKTPSFHVHEPRQYFYCFGCGEKGDVITFLGKIEQSDDLVTGKPLHSQQMPVVENESGFRRDVH